MTEPQYARFMGLIKVLFDNFHSKKNMFKEKMVIVTVTDILGESITFKLRKESNVTELGLRMLIGNRLKDLEKINKRLDLDNKCDLKLNTVDKIKKKKPRPQVKKKLVKKGFNKNGNRNRRLR